MSDIRDREVKWLAGEVEAWVRNLGYPVGMGIAPAHPMTRRFAEGIFDSWMRRLNAKALTSTDSGGK